MIGFCVFSIFRLVWNWTVIFNLLLCRSEDVEPQIWMLTFDSMEFYFFLPLWNPSCIVFIWRACIRFKSFGRSTLFSRNFDWNNLHPPFERPASFGIRRASVSALQPFITANGSVQIRVRACLVLFFSGGCNLLSLLSSQSRECFFFFGKFCASVARARRVAAIST